jgi:pre-mRNA-splicing helicase BRR2
VKEISAQVPAARVPAGGRTTVFVTLERGGDAEADGEDGQAKAAVPLVLCPRYPKRKEEGWWLVVGDLSSNALLSLKYVAFARSAKVKLEISAPTAPGEHALELFLISDSYVGDCDQQDEFSIVVLPDQGAEGGGRSDDATAQHSQQ